MKPRRKRRRQRLRQSLPLKETTGRARPPPRGGVRVDPLQTEFLMRLANALNTTLDLQTLMHRTAELVRAVIDYKIFAILLLNERTNDLRMRFQIGHTAEIERLRIRMGEGVVGQAAQRRESILLDDVRTWRITTSAPIPMFAPSWRCR